METTKFQYNWNKKLGCDCFTTLRLTNPEKYRVGSRHKIMLYERGTWRDYGFATVQDRRVLRINQLNTFICLIDTGYGVDETKDILYKMYKDKVKDINQADFDFVVFKKEKVNGQQRLAV